ncbi:helix-turn-helix transcriptional regulator [Ravibacter arvi]|uniref:Helix-turn-helix transcriptional regulator n=1 Tax=Ravibacter arvi TaxID=2051041 RepID=A0ABP8LRD6_9BACT
MNPTIPKVDICTLSENREEDIMISRFSDYLSRHSNLIAPHRHSFYHLLFFTQGGGKHTIDFHHFDVKPFQIYFMTPGQVHSWDFEGVVDGYVVNFSESFFHSFLLKQDYLDSFIFFRTEAQKSVWNLEGNTREAVSGLFERLIQVPALSPDYRHDMIRAILLQVFIMVQNSVTAGEHGAVNTAGNALLRKYQKLIDSHFVTLRLPSEYAALLHVTPNHLNALCNEHLGAQAGQLIRDRMVLEIKRQLVNLNLSVSEIAYRLDFKDNSYFSRFFRKETGLSPEAFRKKYVR